MVPIEGLNATLSKQKMSLSNNISYSNCCVRRSGRPARSTGWLHSSRFGQPQRVSKYRFNTREMRNGVLRKNIIMMTDVQYVDEEKADELIGLVGADSDEPDLTEEDAEKANNLISDLEDVGRGGRPLENKLIFGNYNVSYVSQGKKQYGQPAGGRFRTGLGKFLFKTVGLYQSVLKPDIVVNKIDLRILGCIPCSVGLRGTFKIIPEEKGGEDNADTVKVFFDPPVLSLPGGIHTRIGPKSSVVLKTTYVDDKIRLGKGSRGSLFVFSRGGDADEAGMDMVGLQNITSLGKFIIIMTCLSMILLGGALTYKCYSNPMISGLGTFLVFLGIVLGLVFRKGGILNDNDDRPEEIQPQVAQ